MKKYNLIGDTHGCANVLKKLLKKLGYVKVGNTYKHPENIKVIFLGDYIDRGTEEKGVINIVKAMVNSNDAIALMGNHEFNAICYATKLNGEYVRKHSEKNTYQHQAFLDEYPFGTKEYKETIEWFKTLPIYFENEDIRAIHASWVTKEIEKIQPFLNADNTLKEIVIGEYHKKTWVYDTIETLLKGIEYNLPNDFYWKDKDGISRNTMRFNWFIPVKKVTYADCALSMPDYVELPNEEIENAVPPYNENKPVFFGHYWLSGTPKKQTDKTACLDYSVAKGGKLVAYAWRGEKELTDENFVY